MSTMWEFGEIDFNYFVLLLDKNGDTQPTA